MKKWSAGWWVLLSPQHMHTNLKSEFSQQSLISKTLLNSVILWNEIMLLERKQIEFPMMPCLAGSFVRGVSDGAERSVNNLPSLLQSWNCIEELSLCIYCVQRCTSLPVHSLLCEASQSPWTSHSEGLRKGARWRIVTSTLNSELETKVMPDGTRWVERTLWEYVQVEIRFQQLSVKRQ